LIWNSLSKGAPYRRAGALGLVTLATVVYGCGSSVHEATTSRTAGGAKLLKPEDYYRYEGEGRNKKKVALSRQEKNKLLHDAAIKGKGQ
jgi:hypothetical protein